MSDEGGLEEAATATSAVATLSTSKCVRLSDTGVNLAEVTFSEDG